jgi:hypothetical protein
MFDFTNTVKLSLVSFNQFTYKQTILKSPDVVNYDLKGATVRISGAVNPASI